VLAGCCLSGCGRAWLPGCRAGWAGFHGPWRLLLPGCGAVRAGQPDGRACRQPIAAVIWLAQRQRSARCSRRRRPLRVSRPAALKMRSRSRLGSHCRAGPGGEPLHPGDQFAGQCGDLAPGLVLRVAVQGEVAQAGVQAKGTFTSAARHRSYSDPYSLHRPMWSVPAWSWRSCSRRSRRGPARRVHTGRRRRDAGQPVQWSMIGQGVSTTLPGMCWVDLAMKASRASASG
jgi:hypothetical protein